MGLSATSNVSNYGATLDRMMGIGKPEAAVKMDGNTLVLGVMAPVTAQDFQKTKGGAA
jgi:hypothetical protein